MIKRNRLGAFVGCRLEVVIDLFGATRKSRSIMALRIEWLNGVAARCDATIYSDTTVFLCRRKAERRASVGTAGVSSAAKNAS